MSSHLSIAAMLAELEGHVADHRRQEEEHARQEVFHRERRAFHAGELETAEERLAAFRAAAVAAGELVERRRAETAPPPPDDAMPPGRKRPVGRLVARIVASLRPEDVFGPTDVAREVNARYGAHLKHPVDGRAASVTLRRLAATGQIHRVRHGTAHHEAQYSRTRPAGSGSR